MRWLKSRENRTWENPKAGRDGNIFNRSQMAMVQNCFGSHFLVGEFTTHFGTYFSGIGMFTGGTGF